MVAMDPSTFKVGSTAEHSEDAACERRCSGGSRSIKRKEDAIGWEHSRTFIFILTIHQFKTNIPDGYWLTQNSGHLLLSGS